MNIESTVLSPSATSSVTLTSQPSTSTNRGVGFEGFTGALVAQVGLLNAIKTGGALAIQSADLSETGNVAPFVAGAPTTTLATQNVAALLGNNLPPSYGIKDETSHDAALLAVTDALKYIATGTTTGEKAAEAAKNLKDLIAMTIPVQQGPKAVIAPAVPVEQLKAIVQLSLTEGSDKAVPVSMNLKSANDKPDKKALEAADQVMGADGLVLAMILPAALPVEQDLIANKLTSADTIKQEAPLSFIQLSTGDAKPDQSAQASDNVLQRAAVVSLPVQDKQGFNLLNLGRAGHAEIAGSIERQGLSVEGERVLSGAGADIAPLNKLVADTKTDIPPITKPLGHPEWNKDLSERIVWMSSKAIPSAEIRLNPEHLGPISVRVNVIDDQATVVFTAQHAATREALEASIPKLREMMSAQQLNLADVNISQAATDQGRSQAQNFGQAAGGRGQGATGVAIDGIDEVEQEIESGRAVVSKGLLSIYA